MDIKAMDFSSPERECDLVMKGGITSGIVYPRIVLKLASEGKYRFRNVGGTSAGAIAAAVMAAAEYGRETGEYDPEYGRKTGGFDRFYELSEKLAEPGFLFQLFQPTPELKPLMYTLLEVIGKISPTDGLDPQKDSALPASAQTPKQTPKTEPEKQQDQSTAAKSKFQPIAAALRLVNILQRRHPRVAKAGGKQGLLIGLGVAFLLTAIAAIVFYSVAALTAVDLSIWAAVLLFIVLGIPLGWVGYKLGILGVSIGDLLQKVTQTVPQENFFGVCTGRRAGSNPDVVDKTVLTDWLSSEIDRIAHVDHPLTFGDLKNKKVIKPGESEPTDVSIRLNMVTSNLSQNQPYTLPFEQGHLFLFNEQDFLRLFPRNVVEHLKTYGGKQREFTKQRQFSLASDSPFYFLPNPDQMPIVVAMRMSLSFPLLISAVPLYTIKQSAMAKQNGSTNGVYLLDDRHDLQKNWFSDGGISSNFPIHFFDSWLPTRPTFGINLASVSAEALVEQPGDSKQISPDNLTVTPGTLSAEQKNHNIRTDRKDVYLPNIGETPAAEWVDVQDNLLTFLSQIFATSQNYRDTMQSQLPGYRERIVQVRLTDAEGGLNLAMPRNTIDAVMRKGEAAGEVLCTDFDFTCHKWVRLRVLLGLLDDKLRETYLKALQNDKFGAQQLIDQAQAEDFSFEYESIASAQKAKDAVDRMAESAESVWNLGPSLSGDNSPSPKTVLRTMPEF